MLSYPARDRVSRSHGSFLRHLNFTLSLQTHGSGVVVVVVVAVATVVVVVVVVGAGSAVLATATKALPVSELRQTRVTIWPSRFSRMSQPTYAAHHQSQVR